MSENLMAVKDVAATLSVSPRQVWNLNSSGRMPAPVRLGRSVRWRADEIKRWVAAGCPAREEWDALRKGGGG